jgi:peptidoglycan/xylan/chitin deacetylase (PgdA/CDA1 family)
MIAANPRPFVIAIDVEPDARLPDPHEPARWRGFEGLYPEMMRLRGMLAARTGRPARFAWYWRADPQIEVIYGDPAWALRNYATEIAACLEAGDEIGLHVHAYRHDPEVAGGWVADHGDARWIAHCVRQGFAAFADALGRPCRSFRMGDGWYAPWLLDLVAELGADIDLTIEPGWDPKTALVEEEPHTGALPDRRYEPTHPRAWRSERHARGGRAGLHLLPVTTLRLPYGLTLGRWGCKLRGLSAPIERGLDMAPHGAEPLLRLLPAPLRRGPERSTLVWGMPDDVFLRLLDRALRSSRWPIVTSVMRSDAGILEPQRTHLLATLERFAHDARTAQLAIVTPAETLAWLGLSASLAARTAAPAAARA